MKSDQTTISNYDRLAIWLFVYTFIYAFFHILPAFLNYEIKNLLMIADVFDILTPFVMIFFTLPLAIAIPVAVFWIVRRMDIRFSKNPVLSLFFLSYTVALGLFLVWGIWQKRFPEFSELGWI